MLLDIVSTTGWIFIRTFVRTTVDNVDDQIKLGS